MTNKQTQAEINKLNEISNLLNEEMDLNFENLDFLEEQEANENSFNEIDFSIYDSEKYSHYKNRE